MQCALGVHPVWQGEAVHAGGGVVRQDQVRVKTLQGGCVIGRPRCGWGRGRRRGGPCRSTRPAVHLTRGPILRRRLMPRPARLGGAAGKGLLRDGLSDGRLSESVQAPGDAHNVTGLDPSGAQASVNQVGAGERRGSEVWWQRRRVTGHALMVLRAVPSTVRTLGAQWIRGPTRVVVQDVRVRTWRSVGSGTVAAGCAQGVSGSWRVASGALLATADLWRDRLSRCRRRCDGGRIKSTFYSYRASESAHNRKKSTCSLLGWGRAAVDRRPRRVRRRDRPATAPGPLRDRPATAPGSPRGTAPTGSARPPAPACGSSPPRARSATRGPCP